MNTDTWASGVDAERRQSARLYGRTATEIAGPLKPTEGTVRYRRTLSRRQQVSVQVVGFLHMALALGLAVFLLLPANLPWRGPDPLGNAVAGFGLVIAVLLQLIAGLRTWTIAYHAGRARDPIPMLTPPGLRVAVLTTIVPGREPVELVMTTLRAMQRIRHDGVLDVWLLDEGDDPEIRRRCEALGVRHFSRRGRPEWNQAAGEFRARTKHGNHNSWRSEHELNYDVIAQMDPDHVPFPNFLERTLGYFADPDVAFVVAPQVYGNLQESFVARGAAELAYLFHGIIQRGGNGHDAPLLIGTNHLYRPVAFRQIGGYQDCIIEDHLTSMVIYTAVNEQTGRSWKGVYTPDVIAVGEGPATYSDFFSQQKRWSYGIWQIARTHSPILFPRMRTAHQRRSFFALQSHYPTTAIAWIGGVALSALYLLGGVTVTHMPLLLWGCLFGANLFIGLVFTLGLRRFNLVEHERRSWGLSGLILDLLTGPVYVAAAAAQLAGRPLVYVVTAKGSAATRDTWRTFQPHLLWLSVAVSCIVAGRVLGHDYPTLYVWAALTAVICAAPLGHVGLRAVSEASSLQLRRLSARSAGSFMGHRRLGELLVAEGLLTSAQLCELLDVQATSDEGWRRLGEIAISQGYLDAGRLAAALELAQSSRPMPILVGRR